MKFIKGLTIIIFCFFLGESVSILFSLPVPGNVIGMVILFAALATGIVKLDDVETAGGMFREHLILFFIPGTVGLLHYAGVIKDQILPVILLGIGGFFILFIVAVKLIDLMALKKETEKGE